MSARHWLPLALVSPLLTGCPSKHAFYGRVVTSDERVLRILAPPPSEPMGELENVTPVVGAKVRCEGCEVESLPLVEQGAFFVDLGTSYSTPPPIVLHVSAPGYLPVDVRLDRPPADSQMGLATLVVVLKRAPKAAQRSE